MTFEWDVWSTPLMALGAGAILGAAILWSQRSDSEAVQAEGRRNDLEREHQAALEALRALETEKDKMDPAAYERERKALLARGAAALRALEGGGPVESDNPGSTGNTGASSEPGSLDALIATLRAERTRVGEDQFDAALLVATGRKAPEAAPDEAIAPTWRGALYASAVWGLVALLVVFAGNQSSPRPEGGSMTGGTTMGQGGEGAPAAPMAAPRGAPDFDAMAAPLEKRLAENPKDLGALNELTQLALSSGDAQKAMEYNQRAAEIDPNDADVGASKAVLAAMVGMAPRALDLLEEVLARHPDHPRSITYKGLLLLEEGRHEEAVPVLEKAVQLQPGVMPLQQALAAAKRGEGLPSGPPPGPAPAPSGGGDVVISGTLELGPGASADGAQVLFVSVRSPQGGPPLAAKRLPAGPFPMEFSITSADAIAMGGAPRPFPAQMSISASLDADGNAMSKDGLPTAGSGGVAKGTTGLTLTLE